MAANVYEGMFILDSTRFGRDPDVVSGQIPAMIEKLGGEMLVSRLWEERRLAFPVKGQRKGAYWLAYFRLDGGRLTDLKRQCLITDDILRTLFLKVDPRIVDAVVAHASTTSATAGDDGKDKPDVDKPDEVAATVVEDAIDESDDIETDDL